MIARKHILWAAGAVFLLTLIANIPAALLYAAFKPQSASAQVYGLQGPWAAGQLSGITVNNRLVAQDLRWRFQPAWLLLGRASLWLEGGGQLATLQGRASASPLALRLSDFRIAGEVKRLAALANFSYLPVSGQAGAQIDSLIIKKSGIDTITGRIDLRGLAWTLAREPLPLGDFQIELLTTPEALIAKVSSPSGPLEADGEARLFPDQRYETDIRVRPKPGASEMLKNYLRSLGPADPEGYQHLRQKGQLK